MKVDKLNYVFSFFYGSISELNFSPFCFIMNEYFIAQNDIGKSQENRNVTKNFIDRIYSPEEADIECRMFIMPIELISESGDHILIFISLRFDILIKI